VNKSEVIELLKTLRRTYPVVDTSVEGVEHYYKYLRDFPYATARENIDRYILTEKFPPTIADIRGRLGDQLDSQRSKEEADAYFAQIDLWNRTGSPPPDGYWENVRAKLRGDAG